MSDRSTLPLPTHVAQPAGRSPAWNGGTDLGLLLLRLAVGGPFVGHGLQKVLGIWGGPGPAGFAGVLDGYGFTDPTPLSWVTGLTELFGGALVVLGLATPLAAAGLLAVMLNVVLLKIGTPFFAGTGGWELEFVLGLAAAALALTGPGRIALDNGRVWHRNPVSWGLVCLVVGVAAGLAVRLLLRR